MRITKQEQITNEEYELRSDQIKRFAHLLEVKSRLALEVRYGEKNVFGADILFVCCGWI